MANHDHTNPEGQQLTDVFGLIFLYRAKQSITSVIHLCI